MRLATCRRFATANEPGTYAFTFTKSSVATAAGIVAYRGVNPTTPVGDGESAGPVASVHRTLPLGHFTELVLRVGELELRAFTGEPVGDRVRVSAARALCYIDGQLVPDSGGKA